MHKRKQAIKHFANVAILGGGLQGCCIALELARQGIDATLIEQDHRLMNRASLRNEGKVHLGLVYAKDQTMETAKLQLRGALAFRKLLNRWTGCSTADLGLSTPFNYLVANDSLLSVEQLTSYYERLTQIYLGYTRLTPDLDYLGTRPFLLATLADSAALASYHNPDHFIGGFETVELAIDPSKVAQLVRSAVAKNERIRTLCKVKVESVVRNNGFLEVEFSGGNLQRQLLANQVVNATWANRLAIDSEFGLEVKRGWVHRLKYRIITQLPRCFFNAPSATVVVGRYGDVVIRPDLTAYLSWYPAAMRGWSHDLSPPDTWERDCREQAEPELARNLAKQVIDSIDAWYPGIKNSQQLTVDAGVILAHGLTDVDSPTSGLHCRTDIGTVSIDGYHSVNPGKLTTAPLMAISAVQRITGKYTDDFGPVAALI